MKRSPLRRRSPWRKKPPKRVAPRSPRVSAKKRARDQERHAKQYGCEYGAWLREQRRELGCPLCGRRYGGGPTVLHHTTRKAQQGLAEHQIFLCQECHDKGHAKGFADLEARAGVDLREIAALYAGHGFALGLLPVEPCSRCGGWHSARYMVDFLEEGRTSRVCTAKCEPSLLP